MPPAARVGDHHVCPRSEGTTPHVGGPVASGRAGVLIDGRPAAVVGDRCACAGPPDAIASGSAVVFIGGRPAARLGDRTAHGGRVVAGSPVVAIGG